MERKKTIREERFDLQDEALEKATQDLLRNAQFRVFLWWILENCNIYGMNISANSGMYIHEGQRSVGLKILDHINSVDPTAYPSMMLERAKNELLNRALEKDDGKDETTQ
jgi:hypothetical protein